jgi:hypothetical protein
MHRISLVTLAALAASAPALAQTQNVRPPIAVYWISAETSAGMAGMGGMGAMMGRMMGAPGGEAGKRMLLQLGSSQPAAGEPRAQHDVPAALGMGPTLPLLTPQAARAERADRDLPEGMEKPKGRMLIYWGCGENARPGQPVIIDFAKVAQGQAPAGLTSRRVAVPASPAPGRNRTYGDWPNREDSRAVPAAGSLRGDHLVKGNYSPEIRFSVGERHDFMEPVQLAPVQPTPGGAMKVQWRAVPAATGYFATAMGANEREEVVFWSSSEVQEMGGALMDYVPPAEVARLVREKVVMSPQISECTVPAEVIKAAQVPFFNFIAYGDELNLVHPPRPSDPKQTWEQQWAVKVRLKSTASALLGEGLGGEAREARRGRAQDAPPASQGTPPASQGTPQQGEAPASPVEEGTRILRGILRF